jgi:hypothetical protein
MLAQDYLTLRLVRLKGAEEWSHRREGLAIIFPKSGTGAWHCLQPAQKLGAGDVLVTNGAANFRLSASSGADLVFWCFSVRLDHLYPLFASLEISLLESIAETFGSPKLFPASLTHAQHCPPQVEDNPPHFKIAVPPAG